MIDRASETEAKNPANPSYWEVSPCQRCVIAVPTSGPPWLPKLWAGLNRCEWKIWFQVQHDGNSWEKVESDFDLTRYNIEHTELLRLCTEEYEQRGFTVTVERQNDFKVYAGQATISGRLDLVALRDDEAVIVDAKAAKPNPSHEIQVMLYMSWLPPVNPKLQEVKLSGEVYYGEDVPRQP